jgi:tetratricopeptide (TPR) repeat protein
MHPLRSARCQHNLTIEALAKEARVGASTVWRAEHNYPINAESRRRICAYFHMTPQELGLLQHLEPHTSAAQDVPTEHSLAENQSLTPTLEDLLTAHTKATQEKHTGPLNMPSQPLDIESLLAMQGDDALFDTQTLNTQFAALYTILQDVQDLPIHVQKMLVLGILSRADVLSLAGHRHVSAEECRQVTEALDTSIHLCWQYSHTVSPAQVFIIGQGFLHVLAQVQSFLSVENYQSYYAAATNLLGSAFYSHGFYDIAQRTHEKAYLAALEGADVWNQAQSLNWQAVAANARGDYAAAIRYIEAASRVVVGQEEHTYLRLQAHLYANWAYNASILGEQTLARQKLDTSASFLEHVEQNEEFDLTRWHQLAGDCLLLHRQYTPAIYHLEQSLKRLPAHWATRRVLTLLPLAKAYAYQQERDMSIEIAEQASSAISSIASSMLRQRFVEYLQLLVKLFPRDKVVHKFVTSSRGPVPIQLT